VELLRGQHAAKLDVVTAAANLHAADGRLHVAGAPHELTLDGVTRTDAQLLPTTAADNQIAKKLDIPPQYLRRVKEHHLGLYDANVNGWLAHDPQRRFLIRGLAAGEGETGVMRALLSDQFRIVDNLDVLMSALGGIRQAGAQTTTKADESCSTVAPGGSADTPCHQGRLAPCRREGRRRPHFIHQGQPSNGRPLTSFATRLRGPTTLTA
jgi:hypothetical protein